jgi:hypothetical protein
MIPIPSFIAVGMVTEGTGMVEVCMGQVCPTYEGSVKWNAGDSNKAEGTDTCRGREFDSWVRFR